MVMPTSDQIVSRYLFDSDTPPSDLIDEGLIRAEGQNGTAITVDANEYMTTGGGRFAGVERFNFVRNFLAGNDAAYPSSGLGLPPGVYTTTQLLLAYGIQDNSKLGLQQYYQGVYDSDYADRAYVFGSGEFKINDDALFYVNPDGTREIANICVEPVDDNFNYESTSTPAVVTNYLTKDEIDPSGIGRTVPIHFTGAVVQRYNFTGEDWFTLDVRNQEAQLAEDAAIAAWATNPTYFAGLFGSIVGSLVANDIITYEDFANRYVVYDGKGPNNSNANLDANELLNFTEMVPFQGVVVVAGGGNDTIFGTGFDDEILGGSGNDVLDGREGGDNLFGGIGDDTYIVDDPEDWVSEGWNEGTDLVKTGASHTLEGNVENLELTGAENVDATGNELDNVIKGNSGNNTLDGKAGADEMNGGGGDDVYIVDDEGDTASEGADQGTDQVRANASHTLGDNIENLELTGSDDISGTGNALDNEIKGNSGNNHSLAGMAGDDTIYGGAGDDSLTGGADNDKLFGEGDADTLLGDGGIDYLVGGDGADILLGGADFDVYSADAQDTIIDSDAKGKVFLDGQLLTGGKRKESDPPNEYRNGNTLYVLDGNTLTINGGLQIHQYNKGDLGIFLDTEPDDEDEPDMDEPEKRASPLVIDLDGDGVKSSAYSRDRYFDHDGNGMLESTAWAGREDGMLVRDLDGNGRITSGRELFGNSTRLTNGTLARNGFEALAELDDNGDGVVDAQDVAFGELRIWRDGDGDGLTDDGELLTLEQAGLKAVRTAWSNSGYIDGNGQAHRQVGSAVRLDDSTAGVSDIWFSSDPARRINAQEVPVEALFDLGATPNAKAFGNMVDLHQALVLNAALRPLLDAYLAEADAAARKPLLQALIYEWAGVSGVDPSGRGSYIDGRQMAVVEALSGRAYRNSYTPDDPVPRWEASNLLRAEFTEFEQYVAAQLSAQVDYADIGIFLAGFASGYSRVQVDWQVVTDHVTIQRSVGDFAAIGQLWDTLRALSVYSATARLEMNAQLVMLLAMYPDLETILSGAKGINGTDESETLYGTSANEVISALKGDDNLFGQAGDDTYVYRPGDGHDVLFDQQGLDQLLLLGGILPEHLTITRDVSAIRIDINVGGTAGSVRISNVFEGTQGALREGVIESIRFSDGTSWSLNRILSEIRQPSTPGKDMMYGSLADETFAAGEGDDELYGYGGNDTLRGEDGDDRLEGGDGNDALHGGDGTDRLIGGQGDDTLEGGQGNDLLEGGDGTDVLHGGDGADSLIGGQGNDQLTGGLGGDHLEGGYGDDRYFFVRGDGRDVINDTVGHSIIYISGLSVEEVYFRREGTELAIRFASSPNDEIRLQYFFDPTTGLALSGLRMDPGTGTPWDITAAALDGEVMKGTSLDDVIQGNALDNVTDGLAGNDVIRGHDGADHLTGSSGDDRLYGDAGNDTLTGGDGTDLLEGGAGDDILTGDAGNDQLLGGAGDDRLDGGDDHDTLVGEDGVDILVGGGGNDVLSGGAQADVLTGGVGNDTLDGGTGADQLSGGTGDDVYLVDDVGDVVTEAAASGVDLVRSSVSYTVADGVEILELIGTSHVEATGDAMTNRLIGNEGNNRIDGLGGDDELDGGRGDDELLGGAGRDRLDGGDGVDRLVGGTGDDLYIVDRSDDVIVEAAGEGADTVHARNAYALSEHIETLVLEEGYGSIAGAGNTSDNLILGNSASNRIDGGAGDDRMEGGDGDDTYVVDVIGDIVVELADQGRDTVESSIDYTLGATLENLVLTSTADLDGTGNGSDNMLVGNAGDNRLDGGLGGDDMYGGAGNDYFINESSQDWIYEYEGEGSDTVERRYETNLVLSDNVENLILVEGIRTGNGNELDNTITGNAGANTLGGWDGDDILHGLDGDDSLFGGTGSDALLGGNGGDYLDGGEGIDRLEGGAGDDVYITDDAEDVVVEAAGGGTDRVQTTASYALSGNIEYLFLMGNGAINGTGNGLDNYLAGNSAANVIHGLGGSDTIAAAGGDDTLVGGAGDDKYVLAVGSGTDLVDNTGGGFDGVFFEGVVSRDQLTFGRDGDDLLISVDGNVAARVVDHFLGGDAAIDYVQPGTAGAPYLTTAQINQIVAGGGTGYDQVIEGTAAGEQLAGNTGKDLIKGLAGNDQLFGMAGNDTLQGGDGDDFLAGGNGSAAGSGDDRLEGGIGNDTLRGQDGVNTLIGGAGNDSYVYGDGQDVIDNVGGGTDRIFFENGIVASQLAFSRTGEDLVITVNGNANSTVRVTGHFLGGDQAIDFVHPSSGAVLDTAAINAIVAGSNPGGGDGDYPSVITGTSAGEQLAGTEGRDLIKGLGGNDQLFGLDDDDKLEGGDGDDYLSGGWGDNNNSGNDILVGGAGADQLNGEDGNNQLIGGAGDDKYVYWGGNDTIDNTGGGSEWLFFNSSVYKVTRNRMAFHRDGDDLLIRVDGDESRQVRVLKHFLGGDYAIDYVAPHEASALSASQINSQLTPLPSGSTFTAYEPSLLATTSSAFGDFSVNEWMAESASAMPEKEPYEVASVARADADSASRPAAEMVLLPGNSSALIPPPINPARELASLIDAMSGFGATHAEVAADLADTEGQLTSWRSWSHRGHHDGARIRYMEP